MHTTVCDNSVIAQPQHIIRERESQSRQKKSCIRKTITQQLLHL